MFPCAGYCAINFSSCSLTIGTVCLNVYLFAITPKGFFPQQDTGRISGLIQGDQDLSFAAMAQKMREFTDVVLQDPAIDTVTSFTGGGSGGSTARMFAQLKPLNERKLSADQVIARIRGKTARIPGASLYLQSVQDLSVGGRFGGAQYQYTLQADNLNDLNHWAPILMDRMAPDSRAPRYQHRSAHPRARNLSGHRSRHRLAHGRQYPGH